MQKIALIAVLVTFMGGCGRLTSMLDEVVPDRRKDYTRAKTLPDLSVPPGLSSEAIRDQMAIPEKGDRGNYSNYNDNINGEEIRKKIRIRWYGDFFGKINASLEIKERIGSLVKKK